MPSPTPWPMVLAAGTAMMAVGVPTSLVFSAIGILLVVAALIGWIVQLTPGHGEIELPRIPVSQRARPVQASHKKIVELHPGMPGHRVHLPERVHPYSAGAKGGLAGGLVMAIVAAAYGLISGQGLWYPINLLAALVLPQFVSDSAPQLNQFHPMALLVSIVIHLTLSVLVGVLFGILLPTMPKSPVFWGGVVGPLLWTSTLFIFMSVLNPVMNQHVDWPWFIAAQFAYGVTVGVVVVRTEKRAGHRRRDQPSNGRDGERDET